MDQTTRTPTRCCVCHRDVKPDNMHQSDDDAPPQPAGYWCLACTHPNDLRAVKALCGRRIWI